MSPQENFHPSRKIEKETPITRMSLADLPLEIIETLSEHPQFPRVYGLDGNQIASWGRLTVGNRGEFIPYAEVRNNEIVGFGVEHDSRPGVVIIPMRILPEGTPEFYMINQERVFLMETKTGKSRHKFANLSFPQGLMDADESSQQASIRELMQETGLIPRQIYHLGSKYVDQSSSSRIADFKLAVVTYKDSQDKEADLEANEVITGDKWRKWNDLRGISLDTMDMRTTVAINYIEWFLSKQFPQLFEDELTP